MDDPFRVRLNCVDHYQAEPTQFDPCLSKKSSKHEQKPDPRVPVIRVFGATETGQKVCAHIHGAFPYLYIKYDGSLKADQGSNIHSARKTFQLMQQKWMPTPTNSIYQSTMPSPSATVATCMMVRQLLLHILVSSKESRSMDTMLATSFF